MNQQISEGLEICFKTANLLKSQFPNDLMKINNDTILAYQKKNVKCHSKSITGYAYFSAEKPYRVVIKQKQLIDRKMLRTKMKNFYDRSYLFGNFALIELMCHEFAHHRTKGHAKGFKIKYMKFLQFMTNKIISGEFYK